MNKVFRLGLAVAAFALLLAPAVVLAAGFETNGIATVGPTVVNGVTVAPPSGVVTQVTAGMKSSVDTQLLNGQNPQTVAATEFQQAAVLVDALGNTATSTAGAATLSTTGGWVTTEALTTAVGSTYTFTLTNTLITAGSIPQVALLNKTNSGGQVQVTSVTASAGSMVVVFTNVGTTAFNGTFSLVFHL
jgi:hypothetical protein